MQQQLQPLHLVRVASKAMDAVQSVQSQRYHTLVRMTWPGTVGYLLLSASTQSQQHNTIAVETAAQLLECGSGTFRPPTNAVIRDITLKVGGRNQTLQPRQAHAHM